MGKLFGTSGVRGIFNEDLTPEKVLDISLAIGSFYGPGSKSIIGWDCRVSGESISSIVIGGLLSTGVNVDVCGFITTPSFQKYMQDTNEYSFGIIITASHNPPQYNGLKLINGTGLEEYVDVEERIENIFKSKKFSKVTWNKVGKLNYTGNKPVIDHYINSLLNHLTLLAKHRKFKIVFDFANCVSAITIKEFLNKLDNVDAVFINDSLDGRFPNRPSEPKPENLTLLENKVMDVNADFGVGFDGDGDRAIVVDETGVAWWGDYLGTILGKYLKQTIGLKGVATPVTSSSVVDMVLGKEGVKIYRTKVGAKHIVKKMLQEDLILGFEENGGIIYSPHVFTRDGGITTVLTMNVMAYFDDKLSKIMASLPKLYQVKEKLPLPDKQKAVDILKKLYEMYRDKCTKIEMIDGIKLFFSIDEWVLVRPSGTEPILRIFSETNTRSKAKKLVDSIKNEIRIMLENM